MRVLLFRIPFPAMRTVFTVFVSSTSEDLEPYRRAAKDVILDLHWLPVMMEHFGADAHAGTVEACKQRVAEADLVLAILGWRLGWVPGPKIGGDGKKSITQIEIETAKALNKPIVFLLAEKDWPGHLWEDTTARRKQMTAFRSGIDRLAVFFSWEPVEVGKTETLPRFRAKVLRELQRNSPPTALTAGEESPPAPKYPSEEVRRWSEALTAAHERERTIVVAGGDPKGVREEILDLRRKLREGGRLKAGDLLAGRFQLIEALGKGGFATVWKAFDLERRMLVAVKVLHGQYVDDRTRLERFFRGARKMAELHHQGIVRVIEEKVDEGGFHFFVMEYLEGGDLQQAVLGHRLPEGKIGPLLRKLADALSYAHSRGVVHRDVKPANILLDREGHPKLTDFDLVLVANSTGGTRTGAVLGTFLYAAPECMAAPHTAGVAADIYSLAMTAGFCFHGRDLPYDVLRRSDAFFEKLPCPPTVRAALRKGTDWEATERFPSVAALAEAIERGLAAPVEVEKPAPSQRRPAVKPQPSVSGKSLLPYLEQEIASLPETDRSAAVLAAVEHALPLDSNDLRTFGIAAWALDYSPGRSDRASDREKAAGLRERTFAPLRERRPPAWIDLDDPAWASIPGGSFQMGSPEGVGHGDERPGHRVKVSPFRLGIYPVTVGEYSRLTGKSGRAGDLPATSVDWYSAYAYAAWLGGRLPTEAEWEYAARGGTLYEYADREGRKTTLEKVGWFSGNAKKQVQPVGGLEPNPWGLYDMIGNVWEWVADWYGPYPAAPQSDPWGPPSGEGRVVRGGSAWFDAGVSRAAYRYHGLPGFVFEYRGFRVALPAGPELLGG